MSIEELRSISLALPGATEDIKWENHLCFNVGGKMFLVTSPDQVPSSASFKVKDEKFDEISAWPGCMPAPYMARHKWVHIDDINRLNKGQWSEIVRTSHQLIASKLPARTRKSLGI